VCIISARWSLGSVVAVIAAVLIFASACTDRSGTATGADQSSPAEVSASPLTKGQLTAALLTAKDLPAGSTIAPSGGQSDSNDLTGDPGCREADAIDDALDRGTRPDQVAHAAVAFQTADQLGGGDESLSSFTTEAAATEEFSEYVAAADACHSFSLNLGTDKAMHTGKPLPLPVVGEESRAYRFAVSFGGETGGLDMIAFRVGGTLALLTVARVSGAPESGLLEQIASKAAAKLA
jgi:hypothetical protein